MENQNEQLMETYFKEKDIFKRNQILKHFLLNMPDDAKEFFFKSFKKERYLDMKLMAVRGYAAYACETEVAILMKKMLELLKKIPQHTPYDYQEYECMRSVFLMPYLLEHYDYECFRVFNMQLEKQYNDMPDCFKDVFSLDEFGNIYKIRDSAEVSQSWKEFHAKREQ